MHSIKTSRSRPKFSNSSPKSMSSKGAGKVIETLAPEKLTTLRRIATIESVGSSTRIEGTKLTDAEVEKLLSGLHTKIVCQPRRGRSGWLCDAMEMIFEGFASIASTENHIKQPARSAAQIQFQGSGPLRRIQEG